jgi:hypothetical protein
MKDNILIYIAISLLAIAVLLSTISNMAYNYPSQGYTYGENLDVGTNMPKEIK